MRAEWQPATDQMCCVIGRTQQPLAAALGTEGPNAFDLIDASLATSTLAALREHLREEASPVLQITVDVSHVYDAKGWVVTRLIRVEGSLSPAQQTTLAQTADGCPVCRMLRRGAVSVVGLESFDAGP